MFTVSSSAETSAAATATNSTRLLLIQVQPGKRVHYEISPNSGSVTDATTTSPICSGDTVVQFGPSWQISFLENTEV